MHEPAVKLHCSNPSCQGANPPEATFCQHCRIPLVKRYLWAMGEGVDRYRVGSLISDRYWRAGQNWLLDTQPALSPHLPEDIPPPLLPYLRLFAHRPRIPQVYGQVIPTQVANAGPIWLLEYGSFPAQTLAQIQAQTFLPPLTQAWPDATPLRQLHWLWQMARLWQPLAAQKVTATLLDPTLLRARDTLLVIQELRPDRDASPTLVELGQLWQTWLPSAAAAIHPFFEPLCQNLLDRTIEDSDRLVVILDRALEEAGRTPERAYQIYTRTDTGPYRHHNEDACFPEDGSSVKSAQGANVLAIVCDGIGGHEGGEIASQIAIETIQQGVAQLSYRSKPSTPNQIQEILEQTTCAANDAISDRNDSEQRHERQRMGTTLVMALARGHEMYLAHVGDSRIYWLTRSGCYQVTLDDDVASREVRLGYALYREAAQYPSAGALVQALGMNASSRLRPTIERLVIDEDCVFLLCSDGLSDFDRIEQYWETEILPILTADKAIETVGNRLIEIANTQNGHDNVTIALVACRVQTTPQRPWPLLSPPKLKPSPPTGTTAPTAPVAPQATVQTQAAATAMPESVTVIPTPRQKRRDSLPFLLALAIFLGLSLGLVIFSYWWFPEIRSRLTPASPQATPTTLPEPEPSPSPSLPSPPLNVGDAIALREELLLRAEPLSTAAAFPVPSDTIARVLARRTTEDSSVWLELETCPTPLDRDTTASEGVISATEPISAQRGWVRSQDAAIASASRLTASTLPESCRDRP
jgi:protein phosphatase